MNDTVTADELRAAKTAISPYVVPAEAPVPVFVRRVGVQWTNPTANAYFERLVELRAVVADADVAEVVSAMEPDMRESAETFSADLPQAPRRRDDARSRPVRPVRLRRRSRLTYPARLARADFLHLASREDNTC